MDKITCIKYVEAYSEFSEDCPPTKLWVYKAYGYIEKTKEGIILRFVKKVSSDENLERDFVVEGYIIPNEALISENKEKPFLSSLNSLILGSPIGVVWVNLVKLKNTSEINIPIKGTRGILIKNENDYLVIMNPKTVTLEPFSVDNIDRKPTFSIIPKSLILKVDIIHE
ncbi:MAG: hypothetical protein NT098_01400 [Candidatus Parcubacteria bacterium]|nr:hypothetical protein [Candidatus Parcubacteria bacterium]